MTDNRPAHLFTPTLVETAMCLWEAALYLHSNEEEQPEWLEREWMASGAFGMRQLFIYLTPRVEELWDSLGEDPAAIVGAFDWEFCPAVIALMKDPDTLPTKEELLEHFNFIAGE